MNKKKFTFVDLFSGVGGFRIPLEKLGGTCVAYSEIDKNAIEVYKNNFKTSIHNSTFNGEIISNLFSNLNSLNIFELHKFLHFINFYCKFIISTF